MNLSIRSCPESNTSLHKILYTTGEDEFSLFSIARDTISCNVLLPIKHNLSVLLADGRQELIMFSTNNGVNNSGI